PAQPLRAGTARSGDPVSGGDERAPEGQLEVGWSATEILRQRDFAAMSPEEFSAARALMRKLATVRPQRRSRRLRSRARGQKLDLRRLARRSLATGGEPIVRNFRPRIDVSRRVVILCDISGSMEAYTRGLLRVRHAAVE